MRGLLKKALIVSATAGAMAVAVPGIASAAPGGNGNGNASGVYANYYCNYAAVFFYNNGQCIKYAK